jgi:hypothetical protein
MTEPVALLLDPLADPPVEVPLAAVLDDELELQPAATMRAAAPRPAKSICLERRAIRPSPSLDGHTFIGRVPDGRTWYGREVLSCYNGHTLMFVNIIEAVTETL